MFLPKLEHIGPGSRVEVGAAFLTMTPNTHSQHVLLSVPATLGSSGSEVQCHNGETLPPGDTKLLH